MTRTCPTCLTPVSVRVDGTLRKHRRDGEVCPGAEDVQLLALAWPKLLTQSQLRRMHHYTEARVKADMSTVARFAIRAAVRADKLTPVERAVVVLHHRPATRRILDADGLAPSTKVATDALVREGILPADDWRHVPFSGQHIHPPRAGMPACTWLEIRASEEET